MEIQIIQKQCGGTGFLARPHRLHLGAQNAEGVDQLHFILPDAWAKCSVALYLRRSDGTQLAPVALSSEGIVSVDRRLTGCTGGQWMLAAVNSSSGYTAYSRPGSYDAYSTLPTDGTSEELPPTLYEQFVARVLENASAAASAAQKAAASESSCASNAALAQTAARQSSASSSTCVSCADRAEAAAARAELLAPADGPVLSVNGMGGAVQLTAQDINALPWPAQPVSGEILRVLSVDPNTGVLLTDTAPMPDLSPFVRSSTIPSADTPGAVRADEQYGVAVREDGTLTTVPATTEQLDAMSAAFAPVTPAMLPYGIKKCLTTFLTYGSDKWVASEKLEFLKGIGAEGRYLSGLPLATASSLGAVKVGSTLTTSWDGILNLADTAVIAATGTGYVRFVNGLQLCWGVNSDTVPAGSGGFLFSSSAVTKVTSITYPAAFSETPAVTVTLHGYVETNENYKGLMLQTYQRSGKTAFSYALLNFSSGAMSPNISWVAIGRWK